MYDVSLELLFESVNKVLITALGSLYIAIFFSGDTSTASLIGSIPNSVEPSSSNKILSFAFARLASVAFNWIKSPVLLFVNSTSAVKSCPASASSINSCLVSENVLVVIKLIVKSALAAFSIIPPVSAESDAINFSPCVNAPTTFVKRTLCPSAAVVSVLNTNPVAPDETPLN